MKYYITIVLFLVVSITFAQLKLEGVVKDTVGTPLELANVIAINQETKALDSYGITDAKGVFKLNLKKNASYKLQVSYIGMKTFEEIFSTKETDVTKNFTLREDNTLDEVELTYEMPVTVKGDTLIYNADSFKNGTERKLEDVLEKLPGVEINDDGQIEVEGNVVSKLTVNGKDFFDGDSKLATKNIPSNAVDKIQVLRNFSEVGQLRNVTNNQDNVAINIKLKEGKENFWFGDITAGAGTAPDNELYVAQPKLFYYSPKLSVNLIGDLNNIGESALTNRDIRNFGGGFRAPSRSSGTSISLGNNGLNGLANPGNAEQIVTKLVATNFSYSPNKALDISGFLIYNSSRIRSRQESFIQYVDADISDEATIQTGKESTNQGLAKLSASYKPNINNQLDYDVLARVSDDTEAQNVFSSIVGNTSQLDEVTPFSINQNVNYYYTLNDTNIFSFEAQHLLKDEDPFYNAVLVNDPDNNELDEDDRDAFDETASELGLNRLLDSYDLGQNRNVKSNQLDAKLDYYNILNAKSNINFTLGTILSRQDFNSNIFQFLDDNGTQFNPTPTLTDNGTVLSAENDTQYNFSDIYLGAHYTVKTGKFTITPGFSLHAYGNRNIQFGETFEDNFFRILPDFETRIQFKKSESLTFRYNMSNQFTDVTNLARGLVLNNYNSIQYGNPELQNALSHNLNLRYSSFNLFNYTNVFAVLSYSSNIDQIRSSTNFDNVIRTNTFLNSNFGDESLTGFGRFQRTFGKLRASLSTRWNYSKINQFIDDVRTVNEGFTQVYTPELRTNFRTAPNIRLRYRYSVADNDQGGRNTKFITNAPSVEFDAYIWKSLTFRTEYSFTNQNSSTSPSQSFQEWDASFSYRKNKDAKWEYEMKASNLLNIDSQISNGSNNFSVFSSETFIQPRFLTFRIIYTL